MKTEVQKSTHQTSTIGMKTETPDLTKVYNEMIGLFMEVPNVFIHPKWGAYQADDEEGSIDWIEGINTLDYHRDWRLLMPVVEKISTYILAYPDQTKEVTDCKIIIRQDILYGRVVEFIKFLNSQPK